MGAGAHRGAGADRRTLAKTYSARRHVLERWFVAMRQQNQRRVAITCRL